MPSGSEPAVELWCVSGLRNIGQVFIQDMTTGACVLRHRDDRDRDDLVTYRDAQDASAIARFDDAGKYRPLKTAPTLQHGWRLELADISSVRLALDLFYPGRLAMLVASERNALTTTPLFATLARQSGMYRVAARLTNAQADALVGRFCRSNGGSPGCLRTILWKRDATGVPASTQLPPEKFDSSHDQTGYGEPVIPLLCQEACNLLVAEAREMVKAMDESTAASS
jgi:sirohydrochlorin cobaltochelatase